MEAALVELWQSRHITILHDEADEKEWRHVLYR